MTLTEQVPEWFYIVLATGSMAILSALVGFGFWLIMKQIGDNKNDWSEVKKILAEVATSIKLHDQRLSQIDKALERSHIVKYQNRRDQ